MMEFIKAALPWVLLGLALAFFAVNSAKEKDEGKGKKNRDMARNMALGILIGVVLGLLGVLDYATGISIGALWGIILGNNKR